MKNQTKTEKTGSKQAKLADKITRDQKPDDKAAAARQTTASGKARSK